MSVRWLIDKSALARAGKPPVARVLTPRIDGGLIAVSVVTELEVGFSARSTSDHDDILGLLDRLVRIVLPVRAEQAARDTQRRLVEQGQHRAVGVADLLVAAVAKEAGLTVLHYDRDFDLVASVTGQPCEWIVPAGAAD
ncbi:MAG: PIN domain nuclease [Pseudonocardiaceae bacterium]